jgi:hypothetical protein
LRERERESETQKYENDRETLQSVPCGDTWSGVVGTLRPVPDSSSCVKSMRVSSMPSAATCATPRNRTHFTYPTIKHQYKTKKSITKNNEHLGNIHALYDYNLGKETNCTHIQTNKQTNKLHSYN